MSDYEYRIILEFLFNRGADDVGLIVIQPIGYDFRSFRKPPPAILVTPEEIAEAAPQRTIDLILREAAVLRALSAPRLLEVYAEENTHRLVLQGDSLLRDEVLPVVTRRHFQKPPTLSFTSSRRLPPDKVAHHAKNNTFIKPLIRRR